MENNKQNDAIMLAIMQFIHHYDSKVSLQSLINGHSFQILLSQIPESQYNFSIHLNKKAIKWSQQLQNLQIILFKVQQYFEQVHEKCIQTNNIDLIGLTKRQQLGQLLKYFQILMALLMESSQKQAFVETIMILEESSQEVFVQIVKNCLDKNNFVPSKYKSNIYNRMIAQFQQEKHTMQREIQRLCKANSDLLAKVKQYEETVNQLSLDNSDQRSMDDSIDDGKNVKYLEQYIDRLQARIIQITKLSEQQKHSCQQRISDLQSKIAKLEEAQALCKIYKQKYDEIMDQMQKMNIWKRQKAKMQKCIQEKEFIILKINDRIEELSQKNMILQESELQLKLQLEKKQLKLQKMSNQLRKLMENIGNATNSSFSVKLNESLQEHSFVNSKPIEQSTFNNEDQLFQTRKQNQKLQKKCKQLQKQICKLNKKMQRLRILQEDKVKLEQLVFEQRTVHSQQTNLMLSVFYDAFEQNRQVSKQYKIMIQKSQQQFRRGQKRKGSLGVKSKQNFKLSRNSKS